MENCAACLRRLKKTDGDFCLACRKELFDGAIVSATLPFTSPAQASAAEVEMLSGFARRISVSGVQEKFSLRLQDTLTAARELALTIRGGQYILKPAPGKRFRHVAEVPANEHFTMQLARQVFRLPTAACAVLNFSDGSLAYLTRRFDVLADGSRLAQEDFAQLGGRSEQTHGDDYKYDYSHEAMGQLMRQHLPASYLPQATLLFRLILFNYLVSNGDAHLKNFSLHRRPDTGEYVLAPAYDLLNTSLHVTDTNNLALSLFANDFETPSFAANAYLAADDFHELGRRLGLPLSRVRKLLADTAGHEAATTKLLARSFLPEALRVAYAASLEDRRQRLRYSLG